MKSTIAFLLVSFLLGCSSVQPEDESMEQLDPMVVAMLSEQERIGDQLREAEARFDAGEGIEAMAMVNRIYSETHDPRAAEVFGKLALRSARFGAAITMFEEALDAWAEGSQDFERLSDLIALARGLQAYERGNLTTAQACFDQIEDPALVQALADARSSTAE